MDPKRRFRRFGVCVAVLYFASALLSPRLLGQGSINFNNRAVNANPFPVVAPIYGLEPNPTISLHGNATTNGGTVVYSGPLLTGTGWTVQLWAAPAAGGAPLAPIATTVMRPPGPFAGFIVPPLIAPTVPNAAGGSQVNFDLRIWDNRNNTITSWAQVMADPILLHGTSGMFTTAVAEPPNTPPNLVGLTSFALFSLSLPEPGVVPLVISGVILLALTRRLRRKPS